MGARYFDVEIARAKNLYFIRVLQMRYFDVDIARHISDFLTFLSDFLTF